MRRRLGMRRMSLVVAPARPVMSPSVRTATRRSGATNPAVPCAVVMVTRPGPGSESTESDRATGQPASARIVRMRRPGPGPSVVTTTRQSWAASDLRSAAAAAKSPL